jgi:hypothetical protein
MDMPFIYDGYQRCLAKAVDRTRDLLRDSGEAQDSEKMHAVKSVLYAAIERAGMETERLLSARELLRELLALVALQADPIPGERREAMRIIEELKEHHASGRYDVKNNLKFEKKTEYEIRAL